MGLTSQINASISYKYSGQTDFGTPAVQFDGLPGIALGNGTAAQQADKVFADRRTLGASASEELDLAGALVDPLGVAVVFANVKAILVKASAGNTNDVVVGGAAENEFAGFFGDGADTIKIPPGGQFLISAPAAGWTVTGGTVDLLKVANGGGTTSVTYDIFVVGTSA